MSTPNNFYADYPSQRIAELLEELCPDGVPVVPIAKVATRNKGTKITAAQMEQLNTPDGNVLVFAAGATKARIPENSLPNMTVTRVPSVIVKSRGHVDFEYCDEPFTHKTELWSYHSTTESLNPKYLYYFLSTQRDYFRLLARANAVKLPQLKVADTDNFEIPLPPLAIQREIVAILDSFTDLDASLRREKKLRQQQFIHALDQVFDQSKFPSQPLANLGTFTKGKGITKADFRDEGLPAMHYGQIHTQYGLTAVSTISHIDKDLVKNPALAHPGDIVLATTSEDDDAVGKAVAWLGTTDVVVGGDAHVYSHTLEPRYVSYFFASNSFDRQKQTKLTGAKVRRISDKGLAQMTIPVPPQEKQARIADSLQLLDDYMRGVTKEIELRNQQLEYYRDQLLTFPAA